MATIHDVALRAGVSVTTVSRVLNNRGYISQKTRDKVYQTMDELNYRPNEIARSLLRKQSNVIGLIIPDVSHPFLENWLAMLSIMLTRMDLKLCYAIPTWTLPKSVNMWKCLRVIAWMALLWEVIHWKLMSI